MKALILLISLIFFPLAIAAGEIEIWGEEFSPFGYIENGKHSGMVTEIVQHLINDTGISVKAWHMAPWARAFKEAKETPNTLLYTVVRKSDREELFHWIGPVSDRTIYLFKLSSRKDIQVSSWEDIQHYNVGSLIGGASTENLESHGIHTDKVSNIALNVKKLLAGRLDLIDMLDDSLAHIAKQEGEPLAQFEKVWLADQSKKYYIALNKNTPPSIVARLQSSFLSLENNGTLKTIQNKYLQ